MTARIVLLGATGHTGRLTAEQLVARGMRPVLAGRRREPLEALAQRLGGLDVVLADVERPATVHRAVGPGDVVISTVGPFARFGDPAVEAAVSAGAIYFDTTGESASLRRVFEHHGPAAARAGAALIPAFGYDYVPGNLAAAQALDEAGPEAVRVDIAYFMYPGAFPLGKMSGGTRASLAIALLDPSYGFRHGRLVTERGGRTLRRFEIDGCSRPAVSFGTSEPLALPQTHPHLQEINTYLGWFGGASRAMQVAGLANEPVLAVPGARELLKRGVATLVRGSTGGPPPTTPDETPSRFVAIAYDEHGLPIAARRLRGPDGYAFTCRLVAAGAAHAAEHGIDGTGALGPVRAFGVDRLAAMCAGAGLIDTAHSPAEVAA